MDFSAPGFHVGCSGVSRDGCDPGQELCGVQPQTLLHFQTSTGVGLEIRRNPLCRAAWASAWNAAGGDRRDPFSYTHLIAASGRTTRLQACLTNPGPDDPAQ
ncbi:DUF2690 domain-containing protein [Streptomyces sp. L7]